jgi:large subunit ribosomal protein L15
LQKLADKVVTVITPEVLVEQGVTHKKELVKILAKGELTAKMEVKAHAYSAKAKEMIEAAGGTCEKYETK